MYTQTAFSSGMTMDREWNVWKGEGVLIMPMSLYLAIRNKTGAHEPHRSPEHFLIAFILLHMLFIFNFEPLFAAPILACGLWLPFTI